MLLVTVIRRLVNLQHGFYFEKEIKFLGDAVEKPSSSICTILGGAKVSDKIGVIENLIPKSDHI